MFQQQRIKIMRPGCIVQDPLIKLLVQVLLVSIMRWRLRSVMVMVMVMLKNLVQRPLQASVCLEEQCRVPCLRRSICPKVSHVDFCLWKMKSPLAGLLLWKDLVFLGCFSTILLLSFNFLKLHKPVDSADLDLHVLEGLVVVIKFSAICNRGQAHSVANADV